MMDWQMTLAPFVTALVGLAAAVVTGMAPIAVALMWRHFGIQTVQRDAAMNGMVQAAASNAAGRVLANVAAGNSLQDAVKSEAVSTITKVPDSAAALGVTQDAMAAIILGKIGAISGAGLGSESLAHTAP